ncbi:MAG: PrgI family protein [Candidatus Saccharibacteria bacterium]|nr:PrgI family protein [Candidatus Saccharibacteria bacterium]
MAVYKVPQDVEAEDKFLGPLSFKQFLFFGGTAICGYLTFLTLSKGVWPISFVFALPAIAFGVLAFPWSKEQPSELWLAAHIRFLFIKRKRIWDQSGMKDLVTITAPKREVHALTDGLSQDEVRNRFNALASVVDSRGWAIKNLASAATRSTEDTSDRLVNIDTNYQDENINIVNNTTDIMDESTNPLARQFDSMIEDSKNKHRKDTLSMIEEARRMSDQEAPGGTPMSFALPKAQSPKAKQAVPADNLWFLNQNQTPADPSLTNFRSQTVVAPSQNPLLNPVPQANPSSSSITTADEQQVLQKVHQQQQIDAEIRQQSHLKTVLPSSQQPTVDPAQNNPQPASTTPVDPAILNLAGNDDLNIETIARQANKDKLDENEVVIKLR